MVYKKNLLFLCLHEGKMLQRIQTIYLFLAAICSAGLIFVFQLGDNIAGVPVYADECCWYSLCL